MGERGPAQTPKKILQLRNSRRAYDVQDTLDGPEGTPEQPDWISKVAKHVWNEVVPLLEQMQVLTKIDKNTLTRYCQLFARWRALEEQLQQSEDEKIAKQALSISEQLTKLEAQFGMTPSARARINKPEATKKSKVDKGSYYKQA